MPGGIVPRKIEDDGIEKKGHASGDELASNTAGLDTMRRGRRSMSWERMVREL